MFPGKVKMINKKTAEYITDVLGNQYSFIDIPCLAGETVSAEAQD